MTPVASPDQLKSVGRAEVLGALSFALDLTEGQPEGHCVRCCWIGTRIGEKLGLDEDRMWQLYYTLLLKDLGCSSNAARLCQLYLADDLAFKGGYKTVNSALPQVLKFVVTNTGMKAGLAERFRAIVHIARNGGEIARELIETRCQAGADIARMLRFPETVALGIAGLDEHWDGSGQPEGLTGKAIPLYSQIALLSQVIDVFQISAGRQAALDEIKERSGKWFDPELVAAFQLVGSEDEFWEALRADDLPERVFALTPAQMHSSVDESYLDDIAQAFAKVVDSKSPFTAGHSERVTVFTDLIAQEMGFDPAQRRWLKRAALLHDIGKLGVSNTILDKPGKPDEREWAEIRQHPVYSEQILSRISVFADLAHIGGGHHERLDGGGYPRGLKGNEIDINTRIVSVADVFDALTADRPYRAAMPVHQALGTMSRDIGTAFDPVVFAALKRAIGDMDQGTAAA